MTDATSNTYKFTGRELDSPAPVYYMRARYYHTRMQRFVSVDPLGFGGGDVNLYAYVGNSPATFVDPTGLLRFVLFGNSIEAQFSATIGPENFSTSGVTTLVFPPDTLGGGVDLTINGPTEGQRVVASPFVLFGRNSSYGANIVEDKKNPGRYYPQGLNISIGLTTPSFLFPELPGGVSIPSDLLGPPPPAARRASGPGV